MFQHFKGKMVALMADHIDTDIIIPKQFLKSIHRTGFKEALFYPWAWPQGQKDPDFVLHQEASQGASVLVTGENFGSGSSREHAAWALQDFGFQVVIAGSFSDIFFNNWVNNGRLPICLDREARTFLADQAPGPVEVFLAQGLVRAGGRDFSFDLADEIRHRLLQGQDLIDYTLEHLEAIEAYERRKEEAR